MPTSSLGNASDQRSKNGLPRGHAAIFGSIEKVAFTKDLRLVVAAARMPRVVTSHTSQPYNVYHEVHLERTGITSHSKMAQRRREKERERERASEGARGRARERGREGGSEIPVVAVRQNAMRCIVAM